MWIKTIDGDLINTNHVTVITNRFAEPGNDPKRRELNAELVTGTKVCLGTNLNQFEAEKVTDQIAKATILDNLVDVNDWVP